MTGKSDPKPVGLPQPTPEEIKQARAAAGLTQVEAAAQAGVSGDRVWKMWEAGDRVPTAQTWELWLLRVGLHPTMELRRKR